MKAFKKILAICMIIGLCQISIFAQNTDREKLGISFDLEDCWTDYSEGDGSIYKYQNSKSEGFSVICENSIDKNIYSLEQFNKDELTDICAKYVSDEILLNAVKNVNNTDEISIIEDVTDVCYETHNGTEYFKFEKSYTAKKDGYDDMQKDIKVYVTVKNGCVYTIMYERDASEDHFEDFVKILDSITYNDVIKITVDSERIYPDSDPVIINDRTLVPIRAVAEKMNYTVGWNATKRIVTLKSEDGENALNFGIGSDTVLRNEAEEITLDVPAVIIGNRTYLPLRAVAEAMYAEVNWDEETRTVEINK